MSMSPELLTGAVSLVEGVSATPSVRRPNRLRAFMPLAWPATALAALLVFNAIFTPGFFHVQVIDGRLYGSLIDILNRGSPTLLLSLGMTLVIATGGIDLPSAP